MSYKMTFIGTIVAPTYNREEQPRNQIGWSIKIDRYIEGGVASPWAVGDIVEFANVSFKCEVFEGKRVKVDYTGDNVSSPLFTIRDQGEF